MTDRVSGTYTVSPEQLAKFKASWPCHGLPDNLDKITFDYDRGDLVDIVARDEDGKWLDSAEFDGPALVALSEDAQNWLAAL